MPVRLTTAVAVAVALSLLFAAEVAAQLGALRVRSSLALSPQSSPGPPTQDCHVIVAPGQSGCPGTISLRLYPVPSLPTCDVSVRGAMVLLETGAGVADHSYACQKTSAETYTWVQLDN